MAQIVLFNVTNDENYLPRRRAMFNDSRWQEAKRYGTHFLQDRMVAGDFPAPSGGYHNGIPCIANGGENSRARGEFSVYDIAGRSYIYEATTGDLCIANISDNGDTEYYRIAV